MIILFMFLHTFFVAIFHVLYNIDEIALVNSIFT